MRSPARTLLVLALVAALLAVFLYNVDLRGVLREIVNARPGWLAFGLLTMIVNLAIRAWRWQYLLEPLGTASFANAFRATAVGFAANAVLPARAGEIIRPYFLSRRERMSATGAFATVILERVLDMITVLGLLAWYVLLVGPVVTDSNAGWYEAVKWSGAVAAVGAVLAMATMFLLARDPARLAATLARLESVLPSKVAGLLAKVAEKFAAGLAVIKQPRRLLVALVLSVPLWISIAAGIWAVAVAFRISLPFSGSYLIVAFLVIGVAMPTPGAVGGFHAMFKIAATTFFGASDTGAVGAAIVLHLMTVVPSLLLGLLFAAEEGLNLTGMRQLADQAQPRPGSVTL
jgi:glycosyltransferase 2 family protein